MMATWKGFLVCAALTLLCVPTGTDAAPQYNNTIVLKQGPMGRLNNAAILAWKGVNAELTYNVSSAAHAKIWYNLTVSGRIEGASKEKPFHPDQMWAKLTLWRGSGKRWGSLLGSPLPGTWTQNSDGSWLFQGRRQLPKTLTKRLIVSPRQYYFLLTWSPSYGSDWVFGLRAQLK